MADTDSTLRFVGLLESRVFLWAANMDGFTMGSRKLSIFGVFPGKLTTGKLWDSANMG